VEPAGTIDGEDLTPLLAGATHLDRDAVFWHFPHYLPGRQTPASAIRMGDWKLIETFETGRIELYDLSGDLGESADSVSEHPGLAAALHGRLRAWRDAIGAKIPTPNPDWEG
jgi:hypothetical protein